MMFAVPPSLSTLNSQENADDYDGPVMSTCEDDNGESTQEMTQTQPVDYAPAAAERFDHLWGRLIPASSQVKRLDFDHSKNEYTIGRGLNVDYTLTGSNRISTTHIQFKYVDNTVFLTDLSMNGTYLNGQRVKKDVRHMVADRDEISLGSPSDIDGLDYRFIFKCSNSPDPLVGGGIHERYQVGDKIGSGAFATVRKGVNLLTSELVAIKVIVKSKFAKDKERSLLMFERERKIVSRLKHHGIVNYLDYFEDDMSIFLVMELVSGGDLMDYINSRLQSGGYMEEAEGQRLTREMCGALAYLHQQGVVHRDLKPENVLLTNDDPPKAKIADFGLSKAIDSQTFLRTMCGTPAYLAPEVVLNNGGYTALVDSWSLGVIVFAMLSATMPFVPNETQDLRTSLKVRVVMWEYLPSYISDLCQHWIGLMINRDTNIRMNMVLALQHEWLLNEEYETEQSYSQEAYSQMYPNEAAEIRNPPSTSSSSACISPETRDPTPETPSQYASGLDDCSQDLGNLRINSDDPSQWACTGSLGIGRGAADYFPSVPALNTHILYPPHSSKESENDLSGMNALQSAWLPGPIGGAVAPAREDSDLITADGKRKLRSSPSRVLSPILSERSSSPLSSVPSESEMTVTLQKERKKKNLRDSPANGRRVSLRIMNRNVKPGTTASQTPPPAPARAKRRRLTSTANAAGQAPSSTRGRQRSSSAETAKSQPTTRRPRRS